MTATMATTNGHDTSFHQVPLYGGAITVDLPANYLDASSIRPVPDNQEVFVQSDNTTGQKSIIFDILEYVEPSTSTDTSTSIIETTSSSEADIDMAALDTHLSDIITTGDTVQILQRSPQVNIPRFPSGTRALALSARVQPARGWLALGVLVTLVRLKEKGTDLVVTVNVPGLVSGEDGSEAVRIAEKICASLEVKDWGLFGS
jgi:Ran-interacting Mog1 protein